MRYQLYPHIVSDPEIQGGKPVIEGTQVPASTLIEQVAEGKSLGDVAREHSVSVEDVRSALEFGAQRAGEVVSPEMANTQANGASPSAEPEVNPDVAPPREPVTDLGKRLAAIRKRIVASGEHLLSWEELDAEMDEMRRRNLDEL